MPDLRAQLQSLLHGRVGVVGVGAVDQGDDGLGVRLAERLAQGSCRPGIEVFNAGTAPERLVSPLADDRFDTVLYLDAVEFGAAPGAVILLNAAEMKSRFPQISTHKLSLGLLAHMIESHRGTQVWLLGVQPASLKRSAGLSPAVRATLEMLAVLLRELLAVPSPLMSRELNQEFTPTPACP